LPSEAREKAVPVRNPRPTHAQGPPYQYLKDIYLNRQESQTAMLKTIKLVHTAIWAIMAVACLYIFYCGLTGRFDIWLWLSIMLITAETVILMLNKWVCPLTPLARKHTEDTRDNFDIYLPVWLARYNKQIFGSLFLIGLALVLLNLMC
jgi:hypothetical protein